MPTKLQDLLQKLTGQNIPIPERTDEVTKLGEELIAKSGMGRSQFNEILLLLGYDRVSTSFFRYLTDGILGLIDDNPSVSIRSLNQFAVGVDRFRIHAMLRFGNIKYAFKYLTSLNSDELVAEISVTEPRSDEEFKTRHAPLQPVDPIPGDNTYFLGYIVGREIDERLKKNPDDPAALKDKETQKSIVAQGIRNQEAYLASDHMDVYVATSMRERHEYYFVNKVAGEIFSQPKLSGLNLRWFNPTQAYCGDRIDKGLSEALMLKRANCTLYFVQETDTLGKDSELASTLAQGKTVVAFVPKLNDANQKAFVSEVLDVAAKLNPGKSRADIVREQLRLFSPNSAWTDQKVQEWIRNPDSMKVEEGEAYLMDSIRKHYDTRAKTLQETHPLGIQVNLTTGVANGVIVARSVAECVDVIHGVITNRLEFAVDEVVIKQQTYLLLREKITRSIFRVVTGDKLLTNTFWNFYPEKTI